MPTSQSTGRVLAMLELNKGTRVFVVFGLQNSAKTKLSRPSIGFSSRIEPKERVKQKDPTRPKMDRKKCLIPEAISSRYVSGARPVVQPVVFAS